MQFILASGSKTREMLLKNAGVSFDVCPPDFDEEKARKRLVDLMPDQIVHALAQGKAYSVSVQYPDKYIIGADQILVFGGEIITKSETIEEAYQVLTNLQGQKHTLISAVSVVKDGEEIYHISDTSELTMRSLTALEISDYLNKLDRDVLSCVGCYQIEGLGITLFEKITGDYFTILGLPLLPLLQIFRSLSDEK